MKLKNLELKRNRLIYFLLLVSGILFFGIFDELYAMIFLVMIIALPVLSYLFPWIIFRSTSITVDTKFENTLPDTTNTVRINLNSKIQIPYPRVEAEYFISQPFAACNEHEKVNLNDFTFPIRMKHCGKVNLRISRIKAYDLLYLGSFKRRINKEYSYYIYPNIVNVSKQLEMLHQNKAPKKGDDLTEIFELREYREGDPIKAIHWKLSSKKGTLISKVGSDNSDLGTTLFLKLSRDQSKNDQTLSLFHSFSLSLLKEYSFNIAYLEEDEIVIVPVESKEGYEEVFMHILSLPLRSTDHKLEGSNVYTFVNGGVYNDH